MVLQHLKNVVSMDFHAKKDNIFFADVGAKTIYKAKLDDPDSKEPVITDNAKGLEGIAIDWVNDKLYWVDRHTQHMYVSELDGSNRMTVKTGIKDARALVLHPGKGLAFFTRYKILLVHTNIEVIYYLQKMFFPQKFYYILFENMFVLSGGFGLMALDLSMKTRLRRNAHHHISCSILLLFLRHVYSHPMSCIRLLPNPCCQIHLPSQLHLSSL